MMSHPAPSTFFRVVSRAVVMPLLVLHTALAADPAAPAQEATPNDPLALPKGFSAAELVEEKPKFPKPMYVDGWDYSSTKIPNLEKPVFEELRKRRSFLLPKEGALVSQRAKVTSSAAKTEAGNLSMITDGDADGLRDRMVELPAGLQWVQLDLGTSHHLWKILLWHYHGYSSPYYDVVVQVSEDPTFANGVQALFNNDHDNSSGLGKGADPVYVETNSGRLIDGCGAKGRYLRFYSNGNTSDDANRYTEISVYGTPVSTPPK